MEAVLRITAIVFEIVSANAHHHAVAGIDGYNPNYNTIRLKGADIMANRKLNIDLTKPISVESQMALVEYARQHRTQMRDTISEWLNEHLPYGNGDDTMEWWYEQDAFSMKGILYAATELRAWDMYCVMETAVRDSFIDLASDVYELEEESDEPKLKTYSIHYTLNGTIDIVAESAEAAQDLFYSQELEQKVWDDVLTNELVIMDVDEVTA